MIPQVGENQVGGNKRLLSTLVAFLGPLLRFGYRF